MHTTPPYYHNIFSSGSAGKTQLVGYNFQWVSMDYALYQDLNEEILTWQLIREWIIDNENILYKIIKPAHN